MPEHTPGPWRPPTDEDDGDVVILLPLVGPHGCDDDPCPHPEGRGDVVLAAAAPDLLAALRELWSHHHDVRNHHKVLDRCEHEECVAARAAIAQAKGTAVLLDADGRPDPGPPVHTGDADG